MTANKMLIESQVFRIKNFHKNPFYFRVYADCEADNEIRNSTIEKKASNFYKQYPVFNGYFIVSEINDILQKIYSESFEI